jgi:hypothetical protein
MLLLCHNPPSFPAFFYASSHSGQNELPFSNSDKDPYKEIG